MEHWVAAAKQTVIWSNEPLLASKASEIMLREICCHLLVCYRKLTMFISKASWINLPIQSHHFEFLPESENIEG